MLDSTLRFGVVGASGRMGRSVIGLLESGFAGRVRVAARVDRRHGRLDELAGVDAILDFSLPAGTAALVDWLERCPDPRPILVCGTTGLDDATSGRLRALGRVTGVFQASNFSTGVAALATILESAAPMLASLGYAATITETHHVHKLDAPSGTARTLGAVLSPGDPGAVAIRSIREGEVIGRHDVSFTGAADRIVIGHEALDRSLFARGAIEAALWLCSRPDPVGYLTMRDYFRARFG